MKSKKTAPKKTNTKKIVEKAKKKDSKVVTKKAPVVKNAPKKAPKQTEKAASKKIEVIRPSSAPIVIKKTPNLATKLGLFDNCVKRNGRIFLKPPREFATFPDLLALQKKGYDEFINKYLNKLFDSINPVRDIAGEKMYVAISDVKVSEPIDDVKTCKKKELTYGGIITGKVKLVDSQNKKVLFSKRANIGILPLMTASASYIVNGVEKVIISQIVRSYGIFYTKRDFKYSFKIIPENGPWLEVQVEKS
jgi:hypothetical protein